jgi:hypothetical protein
MHSGKCLLPAALACLLLSAFFSARGADDTEAVQKDLQAALAQLTDGIGKHLDSRKETTVVVGEFTGPGKAGPGIQEALIRALKGRKVDGKEKPITAGEKAPLEVRGSYELADDPEAKGDPDLKVLKLQAEFVLSKTGAKQTELEMRPVRVRNSIDLAKLFAVTAAFHPLDLPPDRVKEVVKAINNPTVQIEGTLVSARPKSDYAVEILARPLPAVGAPGQPVKPRKVCGEGEKDCEAFVDIKPGDLYEVRVINRSKHDAAVTLTIDGLDQFTFSEVRDPKTKQPLYKHIILPKPPPGQPESSGVIRGWHRVNEGKDAAFSFLVTEFGKGEASKLLKNSAKVGTIVVTFAAAWTNDADQPDDEKGARSASETAKGPPVAANLKEVTRQVGNVREVVSIRYSK